MSLFQSVLQEVVRSYVRWFLVLLILTVFEIANARSKAPIGNRLNALAFWFISIPVAACLQMGFGFLFASLGLKPLIVLPMHEWTALMGAAATIGAMLLAAMVNDFAFYWYHRAQHRWLWR